MATQAMATLACPLAHSTAAARSSARPMPKILMVPHAVRTSPTAISPEWRARGICLSARTSSYSEIGPSARIGGNNP